ncbi:MAG: hypothetical protein ACLPWS_21050 [Rhodomicrobium sp.]
MKTRTAKLYWTETDGRTGSERFAIDSLHPFSRYGFHRPCFTNLDRTRNDAQKLAFRMRSVITFCDTLGVTYGPHPISLRCTPECFDHTAGKPGTSARSSQRNPIAAAWSQRWISANNKAGLPIFLTVALAYLTVPRLAHTSSSFRPTAYRSNRSYPPSKPSCLSTNCVAWDRLRGHGAPGSAAKNEEKLTRHLYRLTDPIVVADIDAGPLPALTADFS